MTRNQLREHLVGGIDKMLGNWLFMRQLSETDKAILRAQRLLYATDDATVDKLLALLQPKRQS